jgi:sodium-dependent phosphate cotransporter
VPIVAQKIVTLRKAAPFILGANMGTTITAFIAATLNANASSAISIAIAHFLFNLIGVLIFYPVPLLRKVPLELAEGLGKLTLKYRLAGFVYILLTFFFIPFSLIYMNKDSVQVLELSYERKNNATGETSAYRIVSKTQLRNRTGEWVVYNSTEATEPSLIFPVYLKNSILFINKEMYMYNKPGFCWDGESAIGKYHMCVDKILPQLELSQTLKFDSVYVYTQRFYQADSSLVRIYISGIYPIILKQEHEENGKLVATEAITSFSKN